MVSLETLHENPVESPETFDETSTSEFPYHFIFIPDERGHLFYPKVGAYKTTFEFLDENDAVMEAVTFRSECGLKFGGGVADYGDTVRVLGTVWTKRLDIESGVVNFGNTAENVAEVYRTILQNGKPISGQDRAKIGKERIKAELVDSPVAFTGSGIEKFLYNFEHIFETRMLPGPGEYTLRFELEHLVGISFGVAEMQLKLT